MTFARTLSGQPVALEATVIDTVARRVAGRVLVESASEYQQARRVWNGLSDKRPAGIVRCSGVADVLDALRFARDHDLLVALRGGGHNVAGFGTCDAVIDHSPLRGLLSADSAVPAVGPTSYHSCYIGATATAQTVTGAIVGTLTHGTKKPLQPGRLPPPRRAPPANSGWARTVRARA